MKKFAKRNSFRALLVGVIAALLVAACGSSGSDKSASTSSTAAAPTSVGEASSGPGTPKPRPLASKQKLTVAYSGPIEFYYSAYLAQVKNEFKAENLDVEFKDVPVTSMISVLASGQVDVELNSVNAGALNAINKDVPMRFLWNINSGFGPEAKQGMWVRKDRVTAAGKIDPKQAADMKYAIGQSQLVGSFAVTLKDALAGTGVSVKDATLVSISNQDSLLALENGTVDAAAILTPFSLDPGLAKCCVRLPDAKLVPNGAVITTTKVINDKSDALEAFARAILRTQRTYLQGNYHANPEISQILAQWTQQPVADIRNNPPGYMFGDTLTFRGDVLASLQSVWIEAGGILDYKTPLSVSAVADESIVKAVDGQ